MTISNTKLAATGHGRKKAIPLTHHIFDKDFGWISKKSKPHSTVLVTATISKEDHSDFGFPNSDRGKLFSTAQAVVADSGCESTEVSPSFAYRAGIKRKELIPVSSKMNGASREDLGMIGGVVMEFVCQLEGGGGVNNKQLCNVCEKVDKVYLSKQALRDLSCLPYKFSNPGSSTPTAGVTADSDRCSCSKHPAQPPTLPIELPSVFTNSNTDQFVDCLEKW